MKKLLILGLVLLSFGVNAKENRHDADYYLFALGSVVGCSASTKQFSVENISAIEAAIAKTCKTELDEFMQVCMKLYNYDVCAGALKDGIKTGLSLKP